VPAKPSRNAPVGVVVIGAGTMGAFHAESVARLKQANLIAVVDPAEKQAKAVARRLGCRAVAGIDAALDLPDVEAVVIVTPERVREQPIAAALKRRLPIFLEKPLAMTLAEGERLVRQIRAARVPFQIGFQRRFDPAIAEIKQQLASWGPPEILRSLTRDSEPPSLEAGLRCGGIVIATLIHDIDCAQYLAGPIRSVFARGAKLVAKHDHPDWLDTVVVSVAFESGAPGVLEASWRTAYGYDSRVEIHAARGMLQSGGARGGSFHGREGAAVRYPAGFLECFAEAYRREIASFVDAVRSGATPQPGIDAALSSLRVADAVQRSLKSGKPVAVRA
jgi:myo-inositol 2-dehydrogenase/D-chiro-inositol 1-dehydrogenase